MDNFFFKSLNKVNVRGIIQVGANTGQECHILKKFTNNIICFEPIPSVYNILVNNHKDLKCFNFGLGETNEIKTMYIANNNGESSSFLKPLKHLNYYNVKFETNMDLEIKRFDSLELEMKNLNVIISDTQGYEINVLKGFGNLLTQIDLIIIEYINSNLYEDDSNLNSLNEYLKEFGFELIDKTEDGVGWGNACFIKK